MNHRIGLRQIGEPFQKYFKRNMGILIGLVAICIPMAALSPYFLTAENLLNVTRQISTNAIIAFGMTFAILLGGIDLSVGSVSAFSGVLAAHLILFEGFPVWPAFLLSWAVGTSVGLANGLIITKMKIVPFIATLSTQSMVRGLCYLISDAQPIRVIDDTFSSLGSGYVGPIAYPILYMIAFFVLCYILLNRTKFGRHVYAIGGNRTAAVFSGIKTDRVEIQAYTLVGLMSAFAGIVLASRVFSGQPTSGEGYELDAIAAVVLGGTSFTGGIGTIGGTIIGAFIIGFLNNGLNMLNVSVFYHYVAKGAVILLAVYVDMIRKNKQK